MQDDESGAPPRTRGDRRLGFVAQRVRCASDGEPGELGLPTLIGEDVLVGHMAILHGCVVEDRAFVGMGSIVMDGSRIAPAGMIAAGALLPPGKTVPTEELWAGRPAKAIRRLTPSELKQMRLQATKYVGLAASHRGEIAIRSPG